MIVLAGGDLVLPDRVQTAASLVIDGGRIVAIDPRPRIDPAGATRIDLTGHIVVPGFIDVHVHGVDGYDTLGDGDAVRAIAARLPRYGVTAFCPTSVACPPATLARFLAQVAASRAARPEASARVLPAHLESNFISAAYRGAQPASCLRVPAGSASRNPAYGAYADVRRAASGEAGPADFTASDILDVIAAARSDVSIVTLAPELDGGLDLVRALAAAGHRVSLGHSGADFDTATAAIDAGARHATHLFNRMAPMTHRAPGLAGAVLSREEVVAELICDGYHVHPAMVQVAIAAKGPARIMAITDGTAGSGLPVGSATRLGDQEITVGESVAHLADGTLAGSTLTMDRAFANLVTRFGGSLVDAAMSCATTPARALGLSGCGVVADGAVADLTVLDRTLRVTRTFIDGVDVYRA
jgi:N-acetylglucosamine-6-phosphate deacetylase